MLVDLEVSSIREDERWQEQGPTNFGRGPAVRWVVHCEVTLANKDERALLARSRNSRIQRRLGMGRMKHVNPGGDLGEIFGFTVCSPAFKAHPTDGYSSAEMARALVLDRYDENRAHMYLRRRVGAIGCVELATALAALSDFLDPEEDCEET